MNRAVSIDRSPCVNRLILVISNKREITNNRQLYRG